MTSIRITTARLIIRSPVIEDAPAINAAIHASLGSLRPWMPWAKSPPTLADTKANLAGAIAKTDKDEKYRLLLFTPSGTLVGSSGLHAVDWRVPRGEIGYWIDARHAGLGYAREATAAITAFARSTMGLRRVQIIVSDRNQRSWRIPEALGYALEGIMRDYRINPDGQRDHERIYACITDEPRAEEPWAGLHQRAVASPSAASIQPSPPVSSPRIRPMGIDDLQAALDLWRMTPGIGLGEGDDLVGLTAFLARNPRLSQVAEADGRLIGTCLCGHDGRRGMLYHVMVEPSRRRQGLTRAMVAAALDGLARQGIPKCSLFIYPDNVAGRTCWTALGFVHRKDLMIMQKIVSAPAV